MGNQRIELESRESGDIECRHRPSQQHLAEVSLFCMRADTCNQQHEADNQSRAHPGMWSEPSLVYRILEQESHPEKKEPDTDLIEPELAFGPCSIRRK